MEKKILIATYSWSGHTKRLADQIAKLLPGADQYQIAVPAGTYDLTDMYATSDRTKNQLATGELPPLANPIPELDQYNLILVGSPVWSGQPAVPVKQFLNQLTNFAGHLAPFYTDAGVANTLPKDAGAASGLINMIHQIGSSVGLALIVGVTGGMTHGVASYRQSLLMSTICATITLVIIVFVVIPGEQRKNQLKLKH